MPVSKEQAMAMLDHDLSFFMNDIRRLLAHYRIADWEAYLFFRKPDCPQSYVLKYEATAGDEFAQGIVALHATPAAPSPGEPPPFRTTKEAMEWAQRNNVPAVIPVTADRCEHGISLDHDCLHCENQQDEINVARTSVEGESE